MWNNRKIILLSSITHAYQARDYLNQMGIKAYLERIPKNFGSVGCGYGLRVEHDTERVADMIQESGIPVRDIIIM